MENTITYKQLLITISSFILGIISVLIVSNYLAEEMIEFNTLNLVGFVFSIIFAGASIILAITAINLGRSSEKAMIERSEKSIEIQNLVYIKTTEALQKIETSTGVTEKRIEDIIEGRVGDFASRLLDDNIVPYKNKDRLKEQLKTISKEATPEEKLKQKKEAKLRREAEVRYQDYKDETLLYIANLKNSKTIRMSEGVYHAQGIDLLDGLFDINGKKIGVCTFYSEEHLERTFGEGIDEFLNNLALEIKNKTYNTVFLVFNKSSEITEQFSIELENIKDLYKKEISEQIIKIIGNAETIGNKIDEKTTEEIIL